MTRDQEIRVTGMRQLNENGIKNQILFTGSSLMEQFPIMELCESERIERIVYNRGIGGFTTDDFIENIDVMLLDLKPSKVFINIGTNDISDRETKEGDWLSHLIHNYDAILSRLKSTIPDCKVYLMAYYPVNFKLLSRDKTEEQVAAIVRTNPNINKANLEVEKLAAKYQFHYINANTGLTEENGELKEEYTMDGMHMYPDAYKIVFGHLKQFI